jgi:hypothetical protein
VDSEWSFAQVKIPVKFTNIKSIVNDKTIYSCCDNYLITAKIDERGGLCTIKQSMNLLD